MAEYGDDGGRAMVFVIPVEEYGGLGCQGESTRLVGASGIMTTAM